MAETTGLEERVAHIRGHYWSVRQKAGQCGACFAELAKDCRREISRVYRRMDAQFRWTAGIMLTMWVTIILTILIKLK